MGKAQATSVFVLLIAAISSSVEGRDPACSQPKDEGPCRAIVPLFYWNSEIGECEAFDYGGCKGNDNKFETLEECNRRCRCTQPIKKGDCREKFKMFGFKEEKNECVLFNYTGCRGNSNRYYTRKECKKVCEWEEDTYSK